MYLLDTCTYLIHVLDTCTYLMPISLRSLSVRDRNTGRSTSCSSNVVRYLDNPRSSSNEARSLGVLSFCNMETYRPLGKIIH